MRSTSLRSRSGNAFDLDHFSTSNGDRDFTMQQSRQRLCNIENDAPFVRIETIRDLHFVNSKIPADDFLP